MTTIDRREVLRVSLPKSRFDDAIQKILEYHARMYGFGKFVWTDANLFLMKGYRPQAS
jgi:hypothetical protein